MTVSLSYALALSLLAATSNSVMTTRIAEDAIVPIITHRELPQSAEPTRAPIAVYRPATGATPARLPYVILLQREHGNDGNPSHQISPQPAPLIGADHPEIWDGRFDHTQRAGYRFLCIA